MTAADRAATQVATGPVTVAPGDEPSAAATRTPWWRRRGRAASDAPTGPEGAVGEETAGTTPNGAGVEPGAEGGPQATVMTNPEAVSMLFMGEGAPHEPGAVPHVGLRAGEVLVRIELATVCGSDVHTVLGHRTEPTPLVLGHEAVGHVVTVGGGGARYTDGGAVTAGDRVVWSVAVHCGNCDRCLRGIPQKCQTLKKYGHERIEHGWELSGGFASHIHLLAGTPLVRVDERVPAQVLAPAGCGIATAWAALAAAERTVPVHGARVLITGGGLIGLAAAAMAAERGAHVTLSDLDAERRSLAYEFGAAQAHDPAGEAELAEEFDIAIDASGAPAAVASGLEALSIGGVAVWVGSVFPTKPIKIVPERVVRGLITVTGVHNYTPVDLEGAVAFLHEQWQRYPFAGLVGETLPLHHLDLALERAAQHLEVRVGIDTQAPAPRDPALGTATSPIQTA
ncbi:putative phosphonate catabolism associated alcohol dehydrogenase [Leucobacter exalbidus]|uniref:alcohol dehydrogenase n=1 Tax=Leucobacter exalbidus TaxID=662960 RepID=A0A940Q0R9_9MICO|nr:alcohol dehydrogenase catalytic domain-containing protein [Leucobacter exalbidus]MBP1327596.1 putative phosphonate catabolism associated alcohol dehydrogenase [Leucobacter exalbidus]